MQFSEDRGAVVTIVDDEPAVLDVLVRAAHSWHYASQAAVNAEQAIQLLDRIPTPLLVTDIRMPGRGGLWLVREVRQRWPETRITVITAGHDLDQAIKCLNAGAKQYFLKPVNLDELGQKLQENYAEFRCQRAEKARKRDLERQVVSQARQKHRLERQVASQARQKRRSFLKGIDTLVSTIDARDPYTCGHSKRVCQYALRLGQALRLDGRQLKRLRLAAMLHDYGKLGIPESILQKPDRLTEAEMEQIRQHPVIGEQLLSQYLSNRVVLAAIRGHHERLDGSGYPDGLVGPHIPPLARILAIADTFDALTSSRAYRGALPTPEALAILDAGTGTLFEPDYVRAFVDCLSTD